MFRVSGFVSKFQGFRVSGFQSFKASGFQGFKVSKLQGFRVSGFQGFRVSGLQGLGCRVLVSGLLGALGSICAKAFWFRKGA